MKTRTYLIACSLVALLAPGLAQAQDARNEAAETDEIIVTGTRVAGR
jgi:hypothetical protein